MSGSSVLKVYLRHVCYLFYKLSREKPRENGILTYYALVILLYPFVQESSAKTSSKSQKQQKSEKGISPGEPMASNSRELHGPSPQGWPGRIISPGEVMASWMARSSRELEKQGKSNSPWREIFSPGEIRRFHLIWWRGRNPLAKKAQFAMASQISPGESTFCQLKYKSSLLSIEKNLVTYLERE